MEYAYYPGCSLEATGRPYDVSLRLVFQRLGIGLKEIEDWNCCGATSYISMNKLTAYSLTARNLAYAERMGLDVCAPCSSWPTSLPLPSVVGPVGMEVGVLTFGVLTTM